MPRRNHRWDWGGIDPYVAKRRTCAVCGLTGRAYGVGKRRTWDWTDADGTYRGFNLPECPGPQVPKGWRVEVKTADRQRYGFMIYDGHGRIRYHKFHRYHTYGAAKDAGVAKAAQLATGS